MNTAVQIPGDVHIVVAPDDPDSIAGVLLAKAVELQEIAAAANANNEATTSSSFSFDQPAGGAGAPPLPPGAGDGSGLGDDSRVVLVVAGHSKQRLQVGCGTILACCCFLLVLWTVELLNC